jgi:hypothetical protein
VEKDKNHFQFPWLVRSRKIVVREKWNWKMCFYFSFHAQLGMALEYLCIFLLNFTQFDAVGWITYWRWWSVVILLFVLPLNSDCCNYGHHLSLALSIAGNSFGSREELGRELFSTRDYVGSYIECDVTVTFPWRG